MAYKNILTSKSPDDTSRFATVFVENLLKTRGKTGGKPVKKAVVVALQGDLGVGKTTFVKAVARVLGIKNTVTSPTFVLEKVYKTKEGCDFTHLIHIDAYRLENSAELLTLGWKPLVENPHNIIFLEWPERVAETIPKDTKKIKFKFIDETTRKITFWFK